MGRGAVGQRVAGGRLAPPAPRRPGASGATRRGPARGSAVVVGQPPVATGAAVGGRARRQRHSGVPGMPRPCRHGRQAGRRHSETDRQGLRPKTSSRKCTAYRHYSVISIAICLQSLTVLRFVWLDLRSAAVGVLGKKVHHFKYTLEAPVHKYFSVQFRANFVTFSGRGVLLLRRASTNKVLDAMRRGDHFSVVCPQTRSSTP